MKDNPSVSILVPVYKVEQYLARCIDSVLAQDFTDWDLILVDDGSPDRCPEICDEYAQKDERIRVVHKENGGAHLARMTAISVARGKYFVFVDADDWLMPNALSVLFAKIEEGYDIVKGINLRIKHDGSKIKEVPINNIVQISNKIEYLKAVIEYRIPPYLWGGIYKRSLFVTNLLNSIKPIPVGEDWLTNMVLWRLSPKYCFVDQLVYCYYINEDAVMQTKVLSHNYVDDVEIQLRAIADGADCDVYNLIYANRMSAHLKVLFSPEIAWNDAQYRRIRNYVNGDKYNHYFKSDTKYLRLINNAFVYRLYVTAYKLLYRFVKLKGNKRMIID